jgi:hypothetical protein
VLHCFEEKKELWASGKDARKAIPDWRAGLDQEQERGMQFWILFLGAAGVLWVQWVVISVAALGALRRRAQETYGGIGGAMGRFLDESLEAGEMARGFGVDSSVLRDLQQSRLDLEKAFSTLHPNTMELDVFAQCSGAWDRMLMANEVVNLAVGRLPGVLEGWGGTQSALAAWRDRVGQAVGVYNEAVQNYESRRCLRGMPWAARRFGFGAIKCLSIAKAP